MSQPKSNETLARIQAVLREDVKQANEWAQFTQRQRQITAEVFVQTLVLGWLQHKQASLNQLAASGQALGCRMSPSGLHQRMDQRAVMLLGAVLRLSLDRLQAQCRLPLAYLQQFRAIYITDSTQIALPPALAPLFAGNGLNSSLKLQLTWDYLHGHVAAVEIGDGRTPDQTCRLHVTHASAKTLQLFDLGYFKQEALQEIVQAQAFFVCRYQSQTALFDPQTGDRIELRDWLRQATGPVAECVLKLGQRVHLPVRLVARRVNLSQTQARRRLAKKKARKQGYTCRAAALELLGWDLLLTNLPPEHASLEQIFDLYAIRTQIEWVFRLWKDQLGLDKVGHTRIERVLCHVYAHLIGAILCHELTASWRWRDHEYSFAKCLQLIQDQIAAFMACLAHQGRGLRAWLKRLEGDFQRFGLKTKRRKSPSTAQILDY
jgi:hypothetical protein